MAVPVARSPHADVPAVGCQGGGQRTLRRRLGDAAGAARRQARRRMRGRRRAAALAHCRLFRDAAPAPCPCLWPPAAPPPCARRGSPGCLTSMTERRETPHRRLLPCLLAPSTREAGAPFGFSFESTHAHTHPQARCPRTPLFTSCALGWKQRRHASPLSLLPTLGSPLCTVATLHCRPTVATCFERALNLAARPATLATGPPPQFCNSS